MPTLTIDFTNAQANRIATAFKSVLGRDDFTMADYKAWVIEHTKDVVLQEEKRAAVAALPPVSTFDPT
jgi:hypothetical protein